jgi:citrate synthase
VNELDELHRIIRKHPSLINRIGNIINGFETIDSVQTESHGATSLHTVTTRSPSGVDYKWDCMEKH